MLWGQQNPSCLRPARCPAEPATVTEGAGEAWMFRKPVQVHQGSLNEEE